MILANWTKESNNNEQQQQQNRNVKEEPEEEKRQNKAEKHTPNSHFSVTLRFMYQFEKKAPFSVQRRTDCHDDYFKAIQLDCCCCYLSALQIIAGLCYKM